MAINSLPPNRRVADRLRHVVQALGTLGYEQDLIIEGYSFADVSATAVTRTVALAAFADYPPDYRNACIGVTVAGRTSGLENVRQCLYLGAPLVLELAEDLVSQWKFTGPGTPEQVRSFAWHEIDAAFAHHTDEWRPARIMGAKGGGPTQLDFVDVGLMPALEGQIHQKLDALLKDAIYDITDTYTRLMGAQPDQQELFRLMFRLVAAKVLRDRGAQGGWQSDDPRQVIQAIEEHYHSATDRLPPTGTHHPEVLSCAWEAITARFHFPNLSVLDLVQIYENTFVTRDSRRVWGTHSTPPRVAEYIVRKLPIDKIPSPRRRVLEPCAGHGVFLVSAMRRLREAWTPERPPASRSQYLAERHEYLRRRLIGIERDSFAREVCRLNLMLADFPNPDGWELHGDDVFATGRLDEEVARSTVVLCNPPFEAFTDKQRAQYGPLVSRRTKAAEVLYRILKSPPEVLGFVVPRDFISGGALYREAHRLLARAYGHVELVALPDTAFEYADMETVLLLAADRGGTHRNVSVTCRRLRENTYLEFRQTGREPGGVETALPVPETASKAFHLWAPPELPAVWQYLEGYRRLSSIASIRRGIQWCPATPEEMVTARQARSDWWPGYITSHGVLSPYAIIAPTHHLNPDPANMVGYPMECAWDQVKVLLNAQSGSRSPWRLFACVDYDAVLVTQSFHVAWPAHSDVTAELIAAILNGPVANAWLFREDDKRHNRVATCRAIPVPEVGQIEQEMVVRRVQRLQTLLETHPWQGQDPTTAAACRNLILQIDALVLEAYDLPPAMEEELLAFFAGSLRRGPGLEADGRAYEHAKRQLSREREQVVRVKRYQALITRKYLQGLAADEAAEVARMEADMDEYDAPYYERVLARMRA